MLREMFEEQEKASVCMIRLDFHIKPVKGKIKSVSSIKHLSADIISSFRFGVGPQP